MAGDVCFAAGDVVMAVPQKILGVGYPDPLGSARRALRVCVRWAELGDGDFGTTEDAK